jgi:hypothetical protein
MELALSRAFAEALLESRHVGRNVDRASDVTRVRTLKPEAADLRVNPAWNLAPAMFVEIDSPRRIVANALSSAAATRNRRGIQVLSRPVVADVFHTLDSSTPPRFYWHLPTALLARLDESHRRRSRYLPSEFCCERTFCVSDALGIWLFVGRVVNRLVGGLLPTHSSFIGCVVTLALHDSLRPCGGLI